MHTQQKMKKKKNPKHFFHSAVFKFPPHSSAVQKIKNKKKEQ